MCEREESKCIHTHIHIHSVCVYSISFSFVLTITRNNTIISPYLSTTIVSTKTHREQGRVLERVNRMSRERTHTTESVASYGSNAGLRERANTAGSILSTGKDGGDESAEFLRVSFPVSPSLGRYQKRVSFTLPANPTNASSGYFTTSDSTRRRLRGAVEWLERQRVPAPLYRQGRRLWQRISPSHTRHHQETDVMEDSVFWVQGLDRVVFGTSSAADVVELAGVKPPRYLWYMLSGVMCDILQLSMDIMLHMYIQDASICWATTFFLSVVARHSSHRYLVFGDYVGGYWASLGRMYGGYSIIIVLSTIFNILMTRVATLSHYGAWIFTLLWTGVANYFILKKLWSFGGKAIS